MELSKYIKVLRWPESIREQIVFSDDTKIRLDPVDNTFKLKADSWGDYPLDDNLYVKVPAINPLAHRVWVTLQPVVTEPDGTSIKYRLHDGIDEYYWNGAIWAVSTTSWNTIAEVIGNIETFKGQAGAEHKLGFVINLKTTDKLLTPTITAIKVLFDSYLETQESWLVKSLIPAVGGIRANADFMFQTTVPTTTIDLNDYDLGDLDITDIAGVFNLTGDPQEFDDLLSSYNPGTKIITLTSSQPSGKTIKVIMIYRPLIAISTQQDYTELARVPAFLIEDVRSIRRLRAMEGEDITPPEADTGWQLSGPDNITFAAKLTILSDRLVDQQRLVASALEFFQQTPQIHWQDLDEYLDLVVTSDYDSEYRPNLSDTLSGFMEFEVRNVPYYLRPATELPQIKTMIIELSK